jgi:hypothetical protein
MGYLISHPQLKLEIKIEEIKKLCVHEEIIPRIVERLSGEIKRGIHKHPVIVDKETLVVLDGMHRVAALQHLGYELIPVCLVDYNNPSIRVECWFRTIKNGQKTGESVRRDLEKSGYNLQEIADNELKKKTYDREIIIGILTSRKCYYVPVKIENIKEIYEYIKRLERNLRSIGYNIGYETESDAVNKVKSGKALAVIIAPRITKRDVVTAALSGEVFVHKSTCHVIPARPLFVNVPIEWLNMDPKEANKLLLEHLSKKKLRCLLAGQTPDQRYNEELYVFSDA